MSAAWRVARAAVRRRRLQTFVVGCVAALSTATVVFALALLDASSRPFDRAFDRQHGAHVTATFDPRAVQAGAVAATARRPGVLAAAGPFGTATLPVRFADGVQDVTVVGRPGPGGPVDDIVLREGRWARAPGEIVLAVHLDSDAWPVGARLAAPGAPPLTVVGTAQSVTRTADAWVVPAQVGRLGSAPGVQMLYRFAAARTDAQVGSAVSAVTAGLPADALVHTESYLRERERSSITPLVPFLVTFGVLGLLISVLVVANVISGAVVAGHRHIGVLKAIGFTPGQVVAVYLTMIGLPAATGSVLGTAAGALLAQPLLKDTFTLFGVPPAGLAPEVLLLSLAAVPALALLVALVPAARAGRLPAREAISAGSAPRTGRGVRVQRLLGGVRLPRPVTLGLGMPFARPGRALLTLTAIMLGAATVTFAIGMRGTVSGYQEAAYRTGSAQLVVSGPAGADPAAAAALLRGRPGTAHVTSEVRAEAQAPGVARTLEVSALGGDASTLGYQRVGGRWFAGPGEAVVDPSFLVSWGRSVGQSVPLYVGGRRTVVRIVGEFYLDRNDALLTDRSTLAGMPGLPAAHHLVALSPGTDPDRYVAGLAGADPRLTAVPVDESTSFARVTKGLIALLTLVLATVAALGVLNSVVLTTWERSRDLGVLKSIGMTPGQLLVTIVTSTAGLGAVGGLLGVPVGVLAHRLVVPLTAEVSGTRFPPSFLAVWSGPALALPLLAGTAIAVLGAVPPAARAARSTIAAVLRSE